MFPQMKSTLLKYILVRSIAVKYISRQQVNKCKWECASKCAEKKIVSLIYLVK